MTWHPHREPLRTTLLRTVTIALAVGAAFALARRDLSRLPAAALLALWPALGGHYVELFFLNSIRPRLPAARPAQVPARLTTWYLGGAAVTLGVMLTARAMGVPPPARLPPWQACALGGLAFIALELLVHLVLHLTGRPSFFNGRG